MKITYDNIKKIKNTKSRYMILLPLLLSVILYFVIFGIGVTTVPMNKEVQGYYSIWATESDWSNIRFDTISTLVLFNIAPLANGDLQQDYDSVIPDELISIAHDNGVKVIFSFGSAGDSQAIDSILGDEPSKENTLNNILGLMQRHNFDGIDIDIEGINPVNSITGTPNKLLMTNFVKDLRAKLNTANPNYIIRIAIGVHYEDVDKIFDLPVLQNYVEYVMIMGYDYYGDWSTTAGPNSPYMDKGFGNYDVVKHYEGEMDKNKILLGVPWYGVEWVTVSSEKLSERDRRGHAKTIGYKDYIDFVDEYGKKWDYEWQTPWYVRQERGRWIQGYYDDIQSLGLKYDFVISEGLGGVGIWQLEYGTGRDELWQLLKDKFETRYDLKNN